MSSSLLRLYIDILKEQEEIVDEQEEVVDEDVSDWVKERENYNEVRRKARQKKSYTSGEKTKSTKD